MGKRVGNAPVKACETTAVELVWDLPLSPEGIEVHLRDGSTMLIRPIRSSDGPDLQSSFQRMSPRSRYLRFFSVRDQLSDDLVEKFTDIDHDRHRAWVVIDSAATSDDHPAGLGAGVARFIALDDEPTVAEASLAVVDDYQRRGIGRLLLELLIGTAHHSNVEWLRFETLWENRGMRGLLGELDAVKNAALSDGEVLVYDVPVVPEGDTAGALYEILRWIAQADDGSDAVEA